LDFLPKYIPSIGLVYTGGPFNDYQVRDDKKALKITILFQ